MKGLLAACVLLGCCISLPKANAGVPNTIYDHAEPVNLPELLQTKDGKGISSVADWEARRVELLDYFARNIYGVCPVGRPADLAFTPVEPDRDMPEVPAIRRRAKISFSGPRGKWSFNACVFLPKSASADRPAPAFLLICNRGLEKFADIDRTVKSDFCPVEEIVRRGYAAAVFRNTELASDRYVPAFSADADSLRIVASVAERRGSSCADPVVPSVMLFCLLLQSFLKHIHQLLKVVLLKPLRHVGQIPFKLILRQPLHEFRRKI